MTPQTLVQTARKLSPKRWKGQQTVIRRLSRTNRLPAKTMHDALRAGAKLYKDESPQYDVVRFLFNNDTPSDVRAEYLRCPYVFGVSNKEDIFGWARQASNATVLKMTHHSGVQALILFERERVEAFTHMRILAEDRTRGEFSWLQEKLASMPWSEKQLDLMLSFTKKGAANIWAERPRLLGAFMTEMERHKRPSLGPNWLDERLGGYRLIDLVQPFENAIFHRAALAESWARLISLNTDARASQVECLYRAAACWHARNPTKEDCLQLADMLDSFLIRLQAQGYTNVEAKWCERSAIVLPWVTMMGRTADEGKRALTIYHELDTGLLNFSTITTAVCSPLHNTIENLSELLCP